jgi:predicted RNase H-like HicB family nuclease
MSISASKDSFAAFSENYKGIYAAGNSIEDVKADTYEAIRLIKENLPEDQWPEQIKGEFEIVWEFIAPNSLA